MEYKQRIQEDNTGFEYRNNIQEENTGIEYKKAYRNITQEEK